MEGGILMRPIQISAETAIKLAERLKVPVEQVMHMPKHILLAKLAELQVEQQEDKNE
jgi:tRNA A37 threonylcarbamoyltransferase TsaD